VLTGLAGDDFVYNDAAYSTEYGYNLLISPAQLERAWADSSVPRHAVAIGLGDSLRPLPIVPNRLMAESLAATAPAEGEDVQAVVAPAPVRVNRGPAAERLREQMLDNLGARTAVLDGEPTTETAQSAPPPTTRLDPSDAAVQEKPSGLAVTDSTERALARAARDAGAPAVAEGVVGAAASTGPSAAVDAAADARDGRGAVQAVPPADGRVVRLARPRIAPPAALLPLGLALMSLGLLLTVGGGAVAWRRDGRPAWATQLVERRGEMLAWPGQLVARRHELAGLATRRGERWDWRRWLPVVSGAARHTVTVASERIALVVRRRRPR